MRNAILIICFMNLFFILKGQGLIFEKKEFDAGQKYEKNRADRIPDSYSMKSLCPYILEQHKANCVAYSSASAITILNAKVNKLGKQDEISATLVSPHWIYYRNKEVSDDDCMDGLNIEKAMKDILNNGVPYIAFVEYPDYYPFTELQLCNYYPPLYSKDLEVAKLNKPDEIFRVTELDDIKSALSNGMPIVAGIKVTPSFEKSIGKASWIPSKSENINNGFGHAVVIVGYDNNKCGGSFELMNSWGEKWGNNGFINVSYKDFMKVFLGGYAFFKEKKLGSNISSDIENNDIDKKNLDEKLSKDVNKKIILSNKWTKLKL